LPRRGHLAMSREIFDFHSSGEGGMLLASKNAQASLPQQRFIHVKMSIVPRLRNPGRDHKTVSQKPGQ